MKVQVCALTRLIAFLFALSNVVFAQQSPVGGNWVQFDGQTDFAAALNPTSLNVDSQPGLTIEAFVSPEAWPTAPSDEGFTLSIIAEKPGSYGLALIANRESSGRVHTGYAFYLNNRILFFSSPGLKLGQWYHIAGVFDNSRNTIGLFVNGNDFISDNPFRDNPRWIPLEFRLAKPTFDVDQYFEGQLDELRISNLARYGRKFVPQKTAFDVDANTLALWHFDEPAGASQLKDASGRGNTLTGQFLVKTPPVAEPPGAPQPGGWYGTTSQGLPVSFQVSNDRSKIDCFTMTVNLPGPTLTKTYVNPVDLSENQFKFSGTENASGEFTSRTNAKGGWNGTFEILTGGIPPTTRKVPSQGTWSATRLVPESGVGPLQFVSYQVKDSGFRTKGDGDGKAEAGETINLQVKIRNTGKDAFVIIGDLNTEDGDIEKITNPPCHEPRIQTGKEATLDFQVKIAQSATTHNVPFALTLTAGNGENPWTASFQVPIVGTEDPKPPKPIVGVQPPPPVTVGSTFTVPVTVENAKDVAGFGFDFTFNPKILEAIQIEEGNFLRADGTDTLWIDSKIDNVAGKIKGIAAIRLDHPGASGDGTLAIVTFKAKNEGTSPLSVENVEFSSPEAKELPHQVQSGEVTVSPDSKTIVEITPTEQTVNLFGVAKLEIRLETSQEIAGYQLPIHYDPALFQFQSAEEGEFLKTDGGQTFWTLPIADPETGIVQIATTRISPGGVSGDGILAVIHLKATAEGTGTVEFQEPQTVVSDSNAQPISVELIPATVTVKQICPIGDVNGDCTVNILDLVLAGQHFGRKVGDGNPPVWMSIGDGSPPDRADVNDDGVVDLKDLLWIVKPVNPPNAIPASPPLAMSADPLTVLEIDRIRPAKDGGFEADIKLSSEKAVRGYAFDLNLSSPAIEVLGISEVNASRANGAKTYFHTSRQNGTLRITAARLGQESGIQPNGVIASVRFQLKDHAAKTAIQIGFSHAQLVDNRGNLFIPTVRAKTLSLEEVMIPERPQLGQNYPNPFNPETWIPFEMTQGSRVAIQIYNSSGSLVRELELGYRDAGMYLSRERAAYWDGRNNNGEQIASGVYFYTLKADSFVATRKMIVVR